MTQNKKIQGEISFKTLRMIEKNKLVVRKMNWQGREGLDIRIFFLAGDGKWYPTKRGVRVPVRLKGEIIKALRKIK